MAQKEEAPETVDTIQDETAPQVNGDKVEKESPDANDISAVEEKAAEEKSDDASEVGFKKIFRFVGFKFTLKKDKSEEKDPVKLLTVKDKEEEEVVKTEEPTEETEVATVEETTAEESKPDTETTTAEVVKDGDNAETIEAADETKKGEAEKEEDVAPPSQEITLSPFRRLFNGGLFSNLRKKASIKKPKEEETKEVVVEEETAKTEDTAALKDDAKVEVEQENKEVAPETPGEEKTEPKEEAPAPPEEVKSETTPEPEVSVESPAPAAPATDETKPEEDKIESSAEEEKAPAEVTSEAEVLSSQEKAKPQGSPLKKLFTGAGLKKLSTKKLKTKKDAETKLTESGEVAAEQLQQSTDSAEAPKSDSGPSSPEESGEHVIAVEVTQIESSQEANGEVSSDGEKKKEGIIAWSSFKKLVTPKRRVKRSSESEDEATGEKPAKSATLSSSESAALADKSVEEETKEDKEDKPTEEEPKSENADKLTSSTEEPKKKMDTSVSWEALMCMGGPKRRTRKTSDSEDEETKIEEELQATAAEGAQEGKTESAIVSSQTTESEGEGVSSPEPLSSHPERESAWDTLKRVVMPKNKAKTDETEQVLSDSDVPKDESSFSFKKFLPGRKKKKAEKHSSSDQGSGEEDSDTPAVVPLSEYNEQVEAEQEAPAEPAAIQVNVSAEERSPSWIPATVDDTDDKHEELSDIPEEAEAVATPKSVDTDITEDETEDEASQLAKTLAQSGRRLSTAEVKPVAPAPSAETTPVPQGPKPENAEEISGPIEAQISEIPPMTSVALQDVPVEHASEKTEDEPPTEKAESKTNTILMPHTREEAMAICTGLGTKEIAKVAQEKPAMPIRESVAVIGDALSTEVAKEEKSPCPEQATVTEDGVLKVQVHQVETTSLEPFVENSLNNLADIQAASESYEPQIEKVGVVSSDPEQSEVLQPVTMSENSPKVVVVDSITPTTEAAVCIPTTEVCDPTIEVKEKEIAIEQLTATEENTPVKPVVEALCETTNVSMTRETDPPVPAIVSSEEVPVITETVVLVAPVIVEPEQACDVETASEPVGDGATQGKETSEDSPATEAEETTAVTDQVTSEKVEDLKAEVDQVSNIEAQSKAIAETVIQDAMDEVSEDVPEPKKPTTPTSSIPTPDQAIATTEKEIETATETPVITDTPNAITCKKSPQPLCVAMEVIDSIPVEVTESLDASVEDIKKPEEEFKKAEEVKVSEESVVVEEVVEPESQSAKEPEQVKDEESKEDAEIQEPDVKETAKEDEQQTEEAKSETPPEEDKEKVLEIHMPVQVVLQTAKVLEEPSVEEEAVVEFDSNGPVAKDTNLKAGSTASGSKLSVLSEEPHGTAPAEVSAPSAVPEAAASQPEAEKPSSIKCAEVMAQVIEVIEEAVKEIEPVSSEITPASWAGETNSIYV